MHGLARAVGIIAVLAAHLPVVVGQLPPFTNGGVAKNFKPTFVGASFQSVLTLSDTVFDLRPTRDLHLYLAFTTKSKLPTALRYSTYTGADVVHGKERRGERKYIQEIECYCQLHANSMTWPKVYAYPLSEGYDQEERDPLNKVSLKNGTGLDAYQKDWNLCWKWSKANATAANPNAQVASSFEVGFGSLPDGYYNHILACRHYTMEPKWDWAGASQVLLKVDSKEPVANITASEYKTGLPWKDNDYHNLPYDTRLEDMIPSDHPVYGSDTLAQRMFKHGVLGFHYAIADRMESQLTRTGALVVPIHGCDSTNCATVQMGSNYTGLSINEFDNSPVTCTGNPTCSLNTPQGAQNKFTMEYTDSRVKGATLAKRFFSDYTYDPGATGMYPAQTTGDWSNLFDAAYATPNVKVADNKISFLNIMFPYVSGAPNSAPMRHPAMPDSYVVIPDAQQHLEVKLTDLAGNTFTFVYPIYIADHTRGANKRTVFRAGSANPTGCVFKFKLETPPPPANATIATFPPLAFKAFTATGTTVNAGGVNPGSGLISSQALSSLSVDGKYRFSVGAWDSSSNKGNYTSIDWNVDTSGPIPQLLRGWDDFNDGNPTTTGSTHTWKFGEDLVYSEYRANSGAWTMVPEAQWVGVAGMSGDTFKLPPMNTTWLPQNLTQYAVNNDPNNPWTRGDRATNNTFEVRGYDALGNPTAAASYGKEVFTIQSLFSMLDCPTCVSVPCDLDDFSSVKLKGIKDKSVPFYVTTYSDSRVFSHPIDSLGSPPAGAPEFYNSWTNMSFPGARFMPCEAGKGCTTLNTTQRFHTFGVDFAGEGLVRVEVHGADNITTSMIDEHGACALLLVDRTPPKLDLSAQGHAGSCKGGDRSHFFGGSIMDASLDVHSLEVKLEKLGEKTAEPFVPGGEVLDGSWSYTTPRIADGKYTLYVTATDSAGNQGEVLSTDFLVDCYAPKTVFTKKPIMFTKNKVNTFHMGCTEEPCAFEYRVDAPYDGEWTEMDGSTFTVEMEKGVHTVEVRAIDAADNRDSTPATYTMTVLDEEWEAQCQARLVEDRSQGYTDPGPTYLHQPIRFKSHTLG